MTIFLIGILSIVLLFAIYRIRVYQHVNTILNNSILHVEVDTAIFHMQIEEFISGDTTVNIQDAIAQLDKTIKLAEAISSGEPIESEQESVSGMVKLLGLQARAEEIRSQLSAFKNLAQ